METKKHISNISFECFPSEKVSVFKCPSPPSYLKAKKKESSRNTKENISAQISVKHLNPSPTAKKQNKFKEVSRQVYLSMIQPFKNKVNPNFRRQRFRSLAYDFPFRPEQISLITILPKDTSENFSKSAHSTFRANSQQKSNRNKKFSNMLFAEGSKLELKRAPSKKLNNISNPSSNRISSKNPSETSRDDLRNHLEKLKGSLESPDEESPEKYCVNVLKPRFNI
ncbi:hypothetical protein SteCoe_35314 [Stentor coeruleus]|uniref:Uncharacterized protein n=1 Tax=Stentor coeruleus TaxID=5963 RepID=A0A1R2ASP1_9CILI|nr:hypothetical protein SteCoe_35314 [Stentor coeruleus]